ncbi:MAG: hypothetical protein ABJQ23_09750 [Shimia thalassica]|uniref:helix-turn-helix transcriptional regulator n=1 Tax=Shimia thalassica TaxID=1715693 RepID=UPI003297F2C3
MASTSLNITIIGKRMFKQSEAADYTGLSSRHFKSLCDVQPVEMSPGKLLWDKHDLDKWIDGMKAGSELTTQASILSKL